MKDAIGGSLLIKIMLIFIAIYISFLAVSINYSQAFNKKNKILRIVEDCEGVRGTCVWDTLQEKLPTVNCGTTIPQSTDNTSCYIEEVSTTRGSYYKITTYISFDFPVVNTLFTFPVTGETKIIYNQ